MTPQSHFNVVARVAPGRERALRALLATMNGASGSADPANAVLPFGAFEELHFARLVLVDDALMNDLRVHGVEPPRLPTCLALLGECDGPARDCLAAMASRAAAGLRTLFAHCDGFDAGGDLLAWLLAHNRPVAAMYVNRIGRTVRQVREEHALWQALAQRAPRAPVASAGEAQQRRRELVEWVGAEVRAGRLRLTPPAPTPLAWRIANLGHALGVPLVGVLLAPLAMVLLPVAIVLLRRHERRDPEDRPPPDPAALRALQDIEDHDLTNQFSATGPVKPGAFRRLLLTLLLVAIDWACRHVFGRGHLGARADDPFRTLGLARRRRARAVRQQLRRQPRGVHGRLRQQGRLGHEPRVQQRRRLAAHRLADHARRAPRAGVQALPAPAPDPDAGLVQGLPRTDADRPRPRVPHPRRPRRGRPERRAGSSPG